MDVTDKKAKLLKALLKEKGLQAQTGQQIPAMEFTDRVPLSYAQERIWFLEQLAPGTAVYNIPIAIRLSGSIDHDCLGKALQTVINRHVVLRTRYESEQGAPIGNIDGNVSTELVLSDLTDSHLATAKELALAQARVEATQPFDLANSPLIRARLWALPENQYLFMIVIHHSVSDGWSIAVMLDEIASAYNSLTAGQEPALEPLPVQYADYAQWQREILKGDALASQQQYWKSRLPNDHMVLQLPLDNKRPATSRQLGNIQVMELPESTGAALQSLANEHGCSLFMLLMAAYQVFLYRYTGAEELYIGTPVNNRDKSELEKLIGFFINTLVIGADLSGSPTFAGLLGATRSTVLEAFENKDLPFEKLVSSLDIDRDLDSNPLFQVMFAFQNTPEIGFRLDGCNDASLLRYDELNTGTSKVDISLVVETDEQWRVMLEYNSEIFNAGSIERMLDSFAVLLNSIIRDPHQSIDRLELLREQDRQLMLNEWNKTDTDFPGQGSVIAAFEQCARDHPDLLAIESDPDLHKRGIGSISYADLNSRANRLANLLQEKGVVVDSHVGICIERSIDLITSILAVVKCGAAYVPLDPRYPPERLEYILHDVQAPVLLSKKSIADTLPDHDSDIICLDDGDLGLDGYSEQNPEPVINKDRLAYIIYTSGSTGKPKGVEVEHRGLDNLVSWHQGSYEVSHHDKAALLAGPAFDASVWEIWPYITCGAQICIPNKETILSSEHLITWLADKGVNITFLATPVAELVLQEEMPGNLKLRYVLTGGDALHVYPDSSIPFKLINHYGPTENTVITTATEVPVADVRQERMPTIGGPIANVKVYILDAHQQLVPVGVPGELYISGIAVARGYHNRPELSAEKFIQLDLDGSGARKLYRTGDLVRYLESGEIEFLGRIDTQVKIRGYRIELGEIETLIRLNEHVDDVVVIAREDELPEKYLCAYVVSAAHEKTGEQELRTYLKKHIPEYMIPSGFVFLDNIPLTSNGKVDRNALPRPEPTFTDNELQMSSLQSATEEIVAADWQKLLHLDGIDCNRNFFDMGGHSLLATRAISQLNLLFDTELQIRDLFDNPTVRTLSARIDEIKHKHEGLPGLFVHVERRERSTPAKLSFAQQRLWYLDQLDPGNPVYNIPLAYKLTGALDVDCLSRSLREIIRSHEVLRTSFQMLDNQPVQIIDEDAELDLKIAELADIPGGDINHFLAEEANKPFDLHEAPLIRVRLIRQGDNANILFVLTHHTVFDGWSAQVFMHELRTLYGAYLGDQPVDLHTLPIQYADYSDWQRSWLKGEVLEYQLGYWKEHLSGELPVLEMPTDYPRPGNFSFIGKTFATDIPEGLINSLREIARINGTTVFMAGLAAYAVLLYRYTGQKDIIVGTVIANRNHPEIEDLIGYFANTLAIRSRFDAIPAYTDLLDDIKKSCLAAYAHQDLPFERLVEELHPERELSHTPIFQTLFSYEQFSDLELPLGEIGLERLDMDIGASRTDLSFAVRESEQGNSSIVVEYSSELFTEATISGLVEHYQVLVDSIMAAPDTRNCPVIP